MSACEVQGVEAHEIVWNSKIYSAYSLYLSGAEGRVIRQYIYIITSFSMIAVRVRVCVHVAWIPRHPLSPTHPQPFTNPSLLSVPCVLSNSIPSAESSCLLGQIQQCSLLLTFSSSSPLPARFPNTSPCLCLCPPHFLPGRLPPAAPLRLQS